MGLGGQRTVMLDFTVRTITNSNVLKIIFSSKHQIYSCSVEDGHNGKPKATIYQQGLDDGSSTSSVIGNFENKDQGNGTESANGNDKNDPVIASLISCASKVFQQTLIKPESLKLQLEHAKIPSILSFPRQRVCPPFNMDWVVNTTMDKLLCSSRNTEDISSSTLCSRLVQKF